MEGKDIEQYEQYCDGLINDHGQIETQKSAQIEGGSVKELQRKPQKRDVKKGRRRTKTSPSEAKQSEKEDPLEIEGQKMSALKNSSKGLSAVEKQRHEDGTKVTQVISGEDTSDITVEINGRRFSLKREKVKETLEKRMKEAKEELEKESDQEREATTQVTTSSIQAADWTGFEDWTSGQINVPVTGDTFNEAGPSHAESASSATVAGAASGYAKAWTGHSWSSNKSLIANFEGGYNASAWNALATSELTLEFFIDNSNGDQIGHTTTRKKSTFLGDYWTEESDYSENIYMEDPPDYFYVNMKAESVAAAIGTSQTAISAAEAPYGQFEGYYNLDNYTLKET
ncbi:hypothetical protein [Halorientalis persicus]|uniref:hypothetical protein n=1 Tax=Halorientalis persicus TaxID=1367881 RepID=UPI0011146057|nr:hypothetical protein [Halorientalis persicus]